MPILIIYATTAMLLLALLPLPYDFYTILRLVAFIVFSWAAYISYKNETQILPWAFGLLLVLFNPIIPIHLSREVWIPIDLGATLFIFMNRNSLKGRVL